MEIPLVSICCQTYNHSNYIKEALEGFLMQVVDFNCEILLRDDASTDGTAEICKDYAEN
jgi:glycosyltransferase involved in cell wall biosynthesis